VRIVLVVIRSPQQSSGSIFKLSHACSPWSPKPYFWMQVPQGYRYPLSGSLALIQLFFDEPNCPNMINQHGTVLLRFHVRRRRRKRRRLRVSALSRLRRSGDVSCEKRRYLMIYALSFLIYFSFRLVEMGLGTVHCRPPESYLSQPNGAEGSQAFGCPVARVTNPFVWERSGSKHTELRS